MNAFSRTVQILILPCIVSVIAATSSSQDVGVGVGLAAGNVAANVTVLTSGPLHEAFARPVVYAGARAGYVHSTPPELIVETPPAEQPEGAVWIPGYWSLDDSNNQWVWVSGSWRVPPPGYTWVPGYWYRTSQGWRYVNGYWAAATSANAEIEYLPEPPAPLEIAAVDTAPYSDAIWVSGNWLWSGNAYAWRRGYWMHGRPDWTWTPASYTWTPYGYVYADGYWDYALTRRGLVYAPVTFTPGSYLTAGFNFSPGYAINIGLFSDSLFVNPAYDMYYYGDYYAPSWWGLGYYPAFAFHMTSFGYDPLFAYASWRSGGGTWVEDRRAHFRDLQVRADARPPRTMSEQAAKPVMKPGTTEGETAQVAIAAKDAAKVTPLPVHEIAAADRTQISAHASAMTMARNERIKAETQAGAGFTAAQPRKVKASGMLMPHAEAAMKTGVAVPEKPELPKVEAGTPARTGTGMKPIEPSPDRLADHAGRVIGEPIKPEPKRVEGTPPAPVPKQPEVTPKPKPSLPEPDAGKLPPPPKRPEVMPVPTPKQPEPAPKPPPPHRPDGIPPPIPEGKPLPPPHRPDGIPPPIPEGKPLPPPLPPKPDGHPQPAPAPKPAPAPAPAPKPQGKPEGGGKPDGIPHHPGPAEVDSRPISRPTGE